MVVHCLEVDVGHLLLCRKAKSGPVGGIDALMVFDHLLGISTIEDEFDNGTILRSSRRGAFRKLNERIVYAAAHIASDNPA